MKIKVFHSFWISKCSKLWPIFSKSELANHLGGESKQQQQKPSAVGVFYSKSLMYNTSTHHPSHTLILLRKEENVRMLVSINDIHHPTSE